MFLEPIEKWTSKEKLKNIFLLTILPEGKHDLQNYNTEQIFKVPTIWYNYEFIEKLQRPTRPTTLTEPATNVRLVCNVKTKYINFVSYLKFIEYFLSIKKK